METSSRVWVMHIRMMEAYEMTYALLNRKFRFRLHQFHWPVAFFCYQRLPEIRKRNQAFKQITHTDTS